MIRTTALQVFAGRALSIAMLLLLVFTACAAPDGSDSGPANGVGGQADEGGEGGTGGESGCAFSEPTTCDPSDPCFLQDPRCWCPEPSCERSGCIDGVAWNCSWRGDCHDQHPGDDCASRGESCWEGKDRLKSIVFYCAPPGCGDGIVQEDEACDAGIDNGTSSDACTTDCTWPPPAARD